MSKQIELPWGSSSLAVSLPTDWRLLGELKPRSTEPAKPPPDACASALMNPVGTQRLGTRNLPGHKVIIAVDDHSRPTPVSEFIQPVLDELALARVREEDIGFLVATGIHRPVRPEEAEWKLGRDVMSRFSWQCHDAYDPGELSDLGVTSRGTRVFINKRLLEADLIVCVGSLEPHLLLGFGGGLKMIIPGCAGVETIAKNHMQGVDPDNFDYVGVHGENSPMRLDLEEGARLLGREIFIVNAAMNEDARPCRFFCGDPIKAHRAGEDFVESCGRLTVPEQSDAVLTNSFPMDADLRQSVKCLGNSLFACKSGGVLMGCAKAERGVGELTLAKKTLPYPIMRGLLRILGKNRILKLVETVKKGAPVEELFLSHFALQMLRTRHLALFSDSPFLPADIGRKTGLARSYTAVQDMIDWAATKVPSRATVWVVPHGGTTYVTRPA